MTMHQQHVAVQRQPMMADWHLDDATSSEGPAHLLHGPIVMNRIRRLVRVEEQVVDLLPREYALLEHFLLHPGTVFTRIELQREVFGYAPTVRTNTVDVHIGHLRRKLAAAAGCEMFRTIRGIGFVFAAGRATIPSVE